MSSLSSGDGAWGDDDDYGVLGDDSEDNWGDEAVDQKNPLISAEQDRQIHSPPMKVAKASGAAMDKPPVALVAVFDDKSQPMVARHVVHPGTPPKQLEEFRTPTQDEYNAIMFGKSAKLVRGGVVGTEVPAGTNIDATMQKTPLGQVTGSVDWKKLALYGGVGVVAISGGWFAYKKLQEKKGKGKKKGGKFV